MVVLEMALINSSPVSFLTLIHRILRFTFSSFSTLLFGGISRVLVSNWALGLEYLVHFLIRQSFFMLGLVLVSADSHIHTIKNKFISLIESVIRLSVTYFHGKRGNICLAEVVILNLFVSSCFAFDFLMSPLALQMLLSMKLKCSIQMCD